jgi:hypothetical protein
MGAVLRTGALRKEDRQRNSPIANLPACVAEGCRLANVVEVRDRFIREAVLEQGYLASKVAHFLNCQPSNVSRALQKT